MVTATLAASAAFAFLAATVYVIVGWRLSRRKVSAEARLAATFFTVWWLGLALSTALGGTQSALGAVGWTPLPVFVTLGYLNFAVVCAALFCLLYYLLFLFTGRHRLFIPLALFYAALYTLLIYYLTVSDPVAVRLNRWNTTLLHANDLSGSTYYVGLVGALVFPHLLGAMAYFSLFFRVRDRTLRYRIAIVSWAIILWFGSAFAGAASGLSSNDSWQIASRAIGLTAALAILVAYEPPGFLKRRLRVSSLSDEIAPASPSGTT